jgi:NhaP-type Na+/H+ or K+/H+ antiporter
MTWNVILTLFGGTLLGLGLSAGLVRNRWYVSEPLLALAIGAAAGPALPHFAVFDGIGPRAAEQAVRFTLTIALVDVAVDLPRGYFLRRWRQILIMLGVVMPLMWLATSLIAWSSLEVSLATALLLGAVLTPTDPVLAASITGGKLAERHVPGPLRRLIVAESGANDALALMFVSFALFLLAASPSETWTQWIVDVVVIEIAGGIAIGIGAGWLTGKALVWAYRQRDAERASLLSVALALALTLLGSARLLQSDGILAAFVAGLVLNHALPEELETQKNQFHETIRRFFELPIFLFLGLSLPWSRWGTEIGWAGALLVLLILVLRRLPAVWLCAPWLAVSHATRDKLFLGWFGPIGVAALFYALLAVERTGDERIWVITTFVVACSVLVHGVTGTALTQRYGRSRANDE